MNLKDFLSKKGTDPKLSELILFFSKQASTIKKGFLGSEGKAGTNNIYGEEQMALDKWADDVIINELKRTRLARWVSSEEQPGIIEIDNPENEFGIVIDPLDGSSLIDVNLAVGTIIGIYPGSVLEPGNTMLAAMYILYGPLTTLTFSAGKGVHDFVMDENGEFNLKEENIRIPEGKLYAPGALRKDYLLKHAAFIEKLETEGYKLRFSGSFVADMHQILHKGGLFTYPGFRGKEDGKLRLLFEANPIGKIITDAGGRISNGRTDILSLKPESINQQTPVYAGGKREIGMIEKLMAD
ncbi:MAG: fructose 1,6-bisphosphatase [Candidatus Methanoperedenaceae archaeon HGW-Methanoperedenaceae-1]|nr:MAG: fructose 1,6-bisphosphatase [Candidatus Methanoperedenaceae archaeon HGW-Methanoperedenaceae-1]